MPDFINQSEIDSFLKHLATLAAGETLPCFRNINSVDNKLASGFDPVTEADRQAERVIRAAIMDRFPDHGIIGEEYGEHQKESTYCWVIDPIDGTRAFISGIPMWGTLIALCKDLKPISGIMSQPFTDEQYVGFLDHTTYSHKGETKKVSTSDTAEISDAILMCTAPDIFEGSQKARFTRLADTCKLTRYGADCYAYCLLAAGHIDLVVEAGLNFYDIAAIIPIVEGAGGMVTDWNGNANPQGGEVLVAANEELHRAALEKLNDGKG